MSPSKMNSSTFTIAAARASSILPVAVPIEACAWCWQLLHPGEPYPEHWSSTICAAHEVWFDRQRAERRARLGHQAVQS